ncbi:MAG: hypothetical protein GY851_27400 [bacterium]|nr:hypothetical protein [bacterium]
MIVFRKSSRVLPLVAVLVFAGEAVALPDTPDVLVPQANSAVVAMARSGDTVYVGGSFTQIGGVARNYLAAFDATTGIVDPAWNPNPSSSVVALAVSGGKVYMGGGFTTVNGGATARNRLAAFNLADGTSAATPDPAWDPNMDAQVSGIVVSGSKVYVGGSFTTVNGGATTRNRLAAFNPADGTSAATPDPAWDPDMNNPVAGHALVVSGGKVYAGGTFTAVSGGATTRNYLAAFNLADGTSAATPDPAWDPNMNLIVTSLAVSGGQVYVGGAFTAANGGATTRRYLAAFNLADGTSAATPDAVWDPNVGDVVTALTVFDGKVYAGGNFVTVNGGATTRNRLAAFNPADGSSAAIAEAWNPNANLPVLELAESGSDGILVGGYFTTVGGSARTYLAGFSEPPALPLSWIPAAAVMVVLALFVVVRRKARSARPEA